MVDEARPNVVVPLEREPARATPPPCVEESMLPVRPPGAALPSETPPLLDVPRAVEELMLMLGKVPETVPTPSSESSP